YDMIVNHPEVAKFYTTEDKQKQLVFLKSGVIEKYGYPGTPAVEVMESKYGQLPSYAKGNNSAHPYYYKQWSDLSEKLTKNFRPSGNAKAILFPGDSRVLVQLPDNKVEIYDMDYQQERARFENLYGKLPGLPPASRDDAKPPVPESGKQAGIVPPAPLSAPVTISYKYLQTPEADTLYWNTVAVTAGQYPAYLLNGKISTPAVLKKAKQENKVKQYEFVVNAEKAKKYGPKYDCMINYITDDVQGTSILPPPSQTDSTTVLKGVKGNMQGVLYTGSATILKVMTDNIPFSELSARVSDGTIAKKENYFVVKPVTPGINVDITLYVKKGTTLKELATRTFRTMPAPEWQTSK
ncbi:MAG TPA: hypothetical protein VLD19_05550, partial [Chitinophagaceae bacterium]|nr:hypothetical protein [Chitinophagaceae bacterium]